MKIPNALLHFDPETQAQPIVLAGLEELRAREVPMALFQKISRVRRALLPLLQEYAEARDELVRRHGRGKKGEEKIDPKDPGFPAFLRDWQQLVALEVEIPDELAITPEDLASFKMVPGAALAKIGPLFRDEETAPKPAAKQAPKPAKRRARR